MGRKDNCCLMQHTPQSPAKNRIRKQALRRLDPTGRLVTVSHGILEAAMMCDWEGPIQAVDNDPGVIQAIKYMLEPTRQGKVDYPELDISPPILGKIETFMPWYLFKGGGKNLQAVDIDLTGCVKQSWKVALPVVHALQAFKVHTTVLLTFRNGRECSLRTLEERISWLRSQLPKGVKYIRHDKYRSSRIREDASRHTGSCMCIVELRT